MSDASFEAELTAIRAALDRGAQPDDPDHSVGEARFLIIGTSALGRVLVVAYTEAAANIIRIISGRTGTSSERRFYEEEPDDRS